MDLTNQPFARRAKAPCHRPFAEGSGGRPKNRVYQSRLASRSDTGTPAKRWVIALI
jgi:hypothetical protein